VGNLTSIKDGRWGEITYAYDPAERLISAIRGNGADEFFTYDRAGNLTKAAAGAAIAAVVYGPGGRLLVSGSTRYLYDDNGRLVKKVEERDSQSAREWSFAWDAKDQLRSVQTPEGVVWKYKYDPLGRRITKEGPEKTVRFVWDRDVVVHEVCNSRMQSAWIFDQNSFEPLCVLKGCEVYVAVCDHLGTPRELVSNFGEVVWSVDYRPWGGVREARKVEVQCPVRFQGQWFDEESGLHYNRFRYYDPANGRFLSADPIALRGGLNVYRYAKNPINWVDPFGLGQKGCGDNEEEEEPGRRGAFRAAKRDADIPMGQQPDDVRRVPMTDRNGKVILDDNHQPVMTREYVFTRSDGSQVVIQDHSAGHRFGEGGRGDQGPHFNVRPIEDTRNGKVPGTQEHYPFRGG
jgi:RHS repeat-associated protein